MTDMTHQETGLAHVEAIALTRVAAVAREYDDTADIMEGTVFFRLGPNWTAVMATAEGDRIVFEAFIEEVEGCSTETLAGRLAHPYLGWPEVGIEPGGIAVAYPPMVLSHLCSDDELAAAVEDYAFSVRLHAHRLQNW